MLPEREKSEMIMVTRATESERHLGREARMSAEWARRNAVRFEARS